MGTVKISLCGLKGFIILRLSHNGERTRQYNGFAVLESESEYMRYDNVYLWNYC
jgi:hypothetical protein